MSSWREFLSCIILLKQLFNTTAPGCKTQFRLAGYESKIKCGLYTWCLTGYVKESTHKCKYVTMKKFLYFLLSDLSFRKP